jgi:hypothetical protein
MKKQNFGRLMASSHKLIRCKTSLNTAKNSENQINYFEKWEKSRKKYSILNVPSQNLLTDFTEPDSSKCIQRLKTIQKDANRYRSEELLTKEASSKKSLAILKKIKRSYRPNFSHNQENLKAELKKINECSPKMMFRKAFDENCRNEVKSDIEQILESQEFLKFHKKNNEKQSKNRGKSVSGITEFADYLKLGTSTGKCSQFERVEKFSSAFGSVRSLKNLHQCFSDRTQTEITPKSKSSLKGFISKIG